MPGPRGSIAKFLAWVRLILVLSFCIQCTAFQHHYSVEPTVLPFEASSGFNPLAALEGGQRQVTFTTLSGVTPSEANQQARWLTAEEALLSQEQVDPYSFPLRDPEHFVAKQLGDNMEHWEKLLQQVEQPEQDTIRAWLTEGVSIEPFLQSFKGVFRGVPYEAATPPSYYQPNSKSCGANPSLIASTLEERLRNGSLRLLGRWDTMAFDDLPICIMPLTLDGKKERLCHDERFLNLFIKDSPFKLDTLRDVPRMLQQDDLLVNTDEKSGYDHIALAEASTPYFGVMYDGWVMTYTTLPFGFKPACYIYQTIGMVVSSYLRSLGVPILQYIDDRLAVVQRSNTPLHSDRTIYAILQLMHRLGYTFSISKCCFQPTTSIRFLGFLVDSVARTFSVPQDKKEEFLQLLRSLLGRKSLDPHSLQTLSGKCSSMAVAVPGALFYIREMNSAISASQRSGVPVPLIGSLRAELEHWLFMETWHGVVYWKKERHLTIKLATDASGYKWAGKLLSPTSGKRDVSDYFAPGDIRPIHQKETEAVIKTLLTLGQSIAHHRVDVLTDSMALIGAWNRQGSKNTSFNALLTELFRITVDFDLELQLQYVNTKDNPADAPSRSLTKQDAKLAGPFWRMVEDAYGPHSCDLMALDSNCMVSSDGTPLRHFTPYATPGSSGINVFTQDITREFNPYVFPPLPMIPPLLAFLQENAVHQCTVVLPSTPFKQPWWPIVVQSSGSCLRLAVKGQKGVLWYPTKQGWSPDGGGLLWDLVAYRMSFS